MMFAKHHTNSQDRKVERHGFLRTCDGLFGSQVSDRPPLNYYGTPETDRKLLDDLKLDTREELLRHLGADMRYVAARYVGPNRYTGAFGYHSGGTDMWGIGWRAVSNTFCTYNDVVHHPLASAASVADIHAHPWPKQNWLSVSHLKDEIATLNKTQRYAIVFSAGLFLETAWAIRGFEAFLMDLVDEPEIAHALLEHVVSYHLELFERALDAADGGIDILWTVSDIGMQSGMMFSPDVWRKHIKPWHRQLVEPFKQRGLRMRYHTDGGITPVIDDLIEIGIDLLDPIQPHTPGMDPRNLAANWGDRLSFYGRIDTQGLLPFGTPQQVEAEVLHYIDLSAFP